MDKTELFLECERCGEEYPASQMEKVPMPFNGDDFEYVPYCKECYERVMQNATMYE